MKRFLLTAFIIDYLLSTFNVLEYLKNMKKEFLTLSTVLGVFFSQKHTIVDSFIYFYVCLVYDQG